MNEQHDITVTIASRDPFFLFGARALLGRDRYARIYAVAPSIPAMRVHLEGALHPVRIVLCDLDSLAADRRLFDDLRAFVVERPGTCVVCLAEGCVAQAVAELEDVHVHGVLAKHDLGYCLHLAVRAVAHTGVTLITDSVRALLTPGSILHATGRVIGPDVHHPGLSPRVSEIILWRIIIGLDNPDIQDELLLGNDTIREYVSKAYHALGASSEIDAFEALSEWWWATRFQQLAD